MERDEIKKPVKPVLNFHKIKARNLLAKMYKNQEKGESGFNRAKDCMLTLLIEIRTEIGGREIRKDNIDEIKERLKYWEIVYKELIKLNL